jgi:hypothetical protein
LFLGAREYGDTDQKRKNLLILDREQFRYQKFMSDLAGQDIRSHEGNVALLIRHVRDWLNAVSRQRTIPGGTAIAARYSQFYADLPGICAGCKLTPDEVTFNDFSNFVSEWLKNASRP